MPRASVYSQYKVLGKDPINVCLSNITNLSSLFNAFLCTRLINKSKDQRSKKHWTFERKTIQWNYCKSINYNWRKNKDYTSTNNSTWLGLMTGLPHQNYSTLILLRHHYCSPLPVHHSLTYLRQRCARNNWKWSYHRTFQAHRGMDPLLQVQIPCLEDIHVMYSIGFETQVEKISHRKFLHLLSLNPTNWSKIV